MSSPDKEHEKAHIGRLAAVEAQPWYVTAPTSGYDVTGEPGAFDREAMEIYQRWSRPVDPDPLVGLLERWMYRVQPCGFARVQVGPDDMQHLQRVGHERRFKTLRTLGEFGPLFGVPVLVDGHLPQGLAQLDGCQNTTDHECRFGHPRWLDAKVGGKIHSVYGCALSALGIAGRAWSQCLDGDEYTHCGARECEGNCEYIGTCGCICHDG